MTDADDVHIVAVARIDNVYLSRPAGGCSRSDSEVVELSRKRCVPVSSRLPRLA